MKPAGFMRIALALSCALVMSGTPGAVTAQTPAAAGPGQPAPAPRKLALLIGINKYKHSGPKAGFEDLDGAENDVALQRLMLTSQFGFRKEDVLPLIGSKATRDAIRDAIRAHLINQVTSPADVVVIHFSGHGSRISDDASVNLLQSTLVAYDSRNPDVETNTDIAGYELEELVAEISRKTPHVTLIIDACHSGGLLAPKGGRGGKERSAPPDPRSREEMLQRARQAQDLPRPTFTLIAAAAPDQIAKEFTVGKKAYGTLTYFLRKEISSYRNARVTYQDIFANVQRAVTEIHEHQQPQLEGPQGNDVVFSDETILSQPFVAVAETKGGKQIVLDAGLVHGVTRGSKFNIYPPHTRQFDATAQLLATATVSDVTDYSSTVTLDKNRKVPVGSRAVEHLHAYPDVKLGIFLRAADKSSYLQSIERSLSVASNLEVAKTEADAKLILADEGEAVVIRAGDSGTTHATIAKSDKTVDIALQQIALWTKWYNVLSIENELPSVGIKFEVLLTPPLLPGSSIAPGGALTDQQQFKLQFQNRSSESLHLVVVSLDDRAGVKVIWDSGAVTSPPGAAYSTQFPFEASLPSELRSARAILKVFATTKRVNLTFLNQPPRPPGVLGTRNAKGLNDPLERLLAQAALGFTRGDKSVPSAWVTAQRTFEIRPAPQ